MKVVSGIVKVGTHKLLDKVGVVRSRLKMKQDVWLVEGSLR